MEEKIECPYCHKEFKKITSNHLKKHNVNYDDYLKEYRPIKYMERVILKFFKEYYINYVSKYLVYTSDGATYTIDSTKVNEKTGIKPKCLTEMQLKKHISNEYTIGIKFAQKGTKVVGIDIDVKSEYILQVIYDLLLNWGIKPTSIFMSISGGKGFHVDVFLNDDLDRGTVNKFFDLIKSNIKEILDSECIDERKIELRGANDQGYKLPLGMHFKHNSYCGACTELGEPISIDKLEEYILTRTKTSTKAIRRIISENTTPVKEDDVVNEEVTEERLISMAELEVAATKITEYLSEEEQKEFEKITEDVVVLDRFHNIYSDKIKELASIYANGFDGDGIRSKCTFDVALYLKSHLGLTEDEALEHMLVWKNRCNGYKASDKVFEKDIQSTVKNIFSNDFVLTRTAKKVQFTKIEIKEILSIECRTKQQTEALRKLYYILFLQFKAYAEENGSFYMSMADMQAMGANNRRSALRTQLNKLGELGKLTVVQRAMVKTYDRVKNKWIIDATVYRLNAFSVVDVDLNVKVFTLCSTPTCTDCLNKTIDYFCTDRNERQKYQKGKCLECPYNPRKKK